MEAVYVQLENSQWSISQIQTKDSLHVEELDTDWCRRLRKAEECQEIVLVRQRFVLWWRGGKISEKLAGRRWV